MKAFLLSLVSCFTIILVKSQPAAIDSLNNILYKTSNDTLRLVLFNRLGDAYLEVNIDSALLCARQYLELSQNLHYKLNEADALQQMAEYTVELGSSGNALELSYKALQLLEDNADGRNVLPPRYLEMLHLSKNLHAYREYRLYIMGKANNMIGLTFAMYGDTKALPYVQKALEISQSLPAEDLLIVSYEVLSLFQKPDSSLLYMKKSLQAAVQTGNKKRIPELWGGMVQRYHQLGDHISELNYLRATLKFCVEEKRILRVGYSYWVLGIYFFSETKARDSVIIFGM
jgi:tetratricopeptide (TPR) repeat protein